MESQKNPKLPVTANFKRSTEEFLFAERSRMKIFRPNRYASHSVHCGTNGHVFPIDAGGLHYISFVLSFEVVYRTGC